MYSFPKGKVNKNESGVECAKREVWEEVGYDISKKISEKVYITLIIRITWNSFVKTLDNHRECT